MTCSLELSLRAVIFLKLRHLLIRGCSFVITSVGIVASSPWWCLVLLLLDQGLNVRTGEKCGCLLGYADRLPCSREIMDW